MWARVEVPARCVRHVQKDTWTSSEYHRPHTHDPMLPTPGVSIPAGQSISTSYGYCFWVGPVARTCAATLRELTTLPLVSRELTTAREDLGREPAILRGP